MTIYKRAIKYFGESSQIIKAIEELAELQKELAKHFLNPVDPQIELNIFEEIADCEIMIEQLKEIFSCHKRVAENRQMKLERLEGRIKDSKVNHA